MSPLMRDGLHHKWGIDLDKFMRMVDETGGWPVGYPYVGFEHTEGREAGFCQSGKGDGWWTVLYSQDDYFMWKLSPQAWERISEAVFRQLVITRPVVERLKVKGWARDEIPAVRERAK